MDRPTKFNMVTFEQTVDAVARALYEFSPAGYAALPGEWERTGQDVKEAYRQHARRVIAAYRTTGGNSDHIAFAVYTGYMQCAMASYGELSAGALEQTQEAARREAAEFVRAHGYAAQNDKETRNASQKG